MITHEIQVVSPSLVSTETSYRHWPYPSAKPKLPAKMDKLEYAKYITNLPFKVGSIIVSSRGSHEVPTDEIGVERMYVVTDIQELHNFVDYDTDMKPRCLFLKNLHIPRHQGFYSACDHWMILKYEELSDKAKSYVDARNSSNSTN
jgi:hypothetical protein